MKHTMNDIEMMLVLGHFLTILINFTKVGNTYNIPLKKYVYQDSGARQSWNDRNLLYQLDGGPARNSQRQENVEKI